MLTTNKSINILLLLVFITFITFLYYYYNPYYLGDSPYYAGDIVKNNNLLYDSGHALWRPIGALLLSVLTLLGFKTDALSAIRILSSFFSTISLYFFIKLCLRLRLSFLASIFAATLLAVSNFFIAYAGSGTSYSSAMCFLVISIYYFLLYNLNEKYKRIFFFSGVLSILISWSFWGTSLLYIPTCAFAIAYRKDDYINQFAIRFIAANFFLLIILFLYSFTLYSIQASTISFEDYYKWWSGASHGTPMSISLTNFLRSIYGIYVSIIFLGDIGTRIKEIILTGSSSLTYIHYLWFFLIFMQILMFLIVIGGLYNHFKNKAEQFKVIVWLFFLSLGPMLIFASLWKGSDIERYSLSLPFFILFAVFGLSAYKKYIFYSFFCISLTILTVSNGVLFAYNRLSLNGIIRQFISYVPKNMAKNDLLVTAGQKFSPSFIVPIEVYAQRRMYNVSHDIKRNGIHNWQQRLDNHIFSTLQQQGKVHILCDLAGINLSQSIEYISNEYFGIGIKDYQSYFRTWESVRRWEVCGYCFFELVLPMSYSPKG